MGIERRPIKGKKIEHQQPTSEERSLRLRVLELIHSSSSLKKIAQLLGAEDYIKSSQVRGKTYRTFDIEGFIASELAKHQTIPSSMIEVSDILIPPGEGELMPGNGNGIERAVVPRTTYLLEVFKEMGIDDVVCVQGSLDPNMFREIGYILFILKQQQKGVFVCDEAENVTFVIHYLNPNQWKEWTAKTKDELRAMPYSDVTPVKFFSKIHWKERMKQVIAAEPGTIHPPKPQAPEYEVAQREVAPEGWIWVKAHEFHMTIEGNDQTIQLSHTRCYNLIDECKKIHPEWVGEFVPRNASHRKKYLHISTEGLAYIQELADKYPPAPAGWATEGQIRATTGIHTMTVKRRSAPYHISNPEWFKKFTSRDGRILDYIAPEMQELLFTQVGQFEYAPEGWYALGHIEILIDRSRSIITPLLSIAVNLFPVECKVYRDTMGHPTMHYTIRVIEWIRQELAKRKPAQPGWMTEYGIVQFFGTERHWTKNRIQEYVATHPHDEEIQEEVDKGRYLRHYSPAVIQYIQQCDVEYKRKM